MSEAALMMLAGKPAASGQSVAEGSPRVAGVLPQEGETGTLEQRFGGLLLQMLDSAGTDASSQSLNLPQAAIPVGEDGNLLPPESPAIAWSALMVWDQLPEGTTTPLQQSGKDATSSGAMAGLAQQFLLSGNLLRQQQQGGVESGLKASTDVVSGSDDLLNQNLLKLLNEQGVNRTVDPRQTATLLTAAEAPENALTPASGSSGQFNQLLAGLGGAQGRNEVQLPPMTVAPQQPGWNNGLGERIQWMVGQNMQQAEIRLEPPELGSLELRISINRDQANLTVVVANSQVRDAVEAAAPRLREMFGDIGLELGDVNVSQESFAEQRQTAEDPDAQGNTLASGDESDAEAELPGSSGETRLNPGNNGLLDLYA